MRRPLFRETGPTSDAETPYALLPSPRRLRLSSFLIQMVNGHKTGLPSTAKYMVALPEL